MVEQISEGQYVFRVFLPRAVSVRLLGDFTGWSSRPLNLLRDDSGWWHAEVAVAVGEHSFRYLVDDHDWLADYAAHGVAASRNGGWVSQLSVVADGAALVA